MHLWNIDTLATELRSGKLSEEQSFRYFFVLLVVQALPFFLPWRHEGSLTFSSMGFGVIIPLLWFITGIAGLIICFRGNQKADGVDFIRRFVCLEIPALIRTVVFCVPAIIIVTLVIISFVPMDSRRSFAFIMMGLFVEMMAIVQYSMIYRRLRFQSNTESGSGRANA